MIHISEAVASIFERGSLPECVELLSDIGPMRSGDVLTWSHQDQAFMHPSGRWVVWALTVRQGWGHQFRPHTAVFDHQKATATRTASYAA